MLGFLLLLISLSLIGFNLISGRKQKDKYSEHWSWLLRDLWGCVPAAAVITVITLDANKSEQ